MPAAPPQALIFDLGNVVVAHDNDLLWRRLAALCAAPPAPAAIRDAVRGSGIGDGRRAVRDLHRELVDRFGMDAGSEAFEAAWSSHFSPMPEMEALVRRLAGSWPLLLLSNTNAEHWRHLRAHYPVLALFDETLVSHELGLLKPDAAIYHEAARRAGRPPARCFFVDDVQANVAGALAAGMDAVRFESAAQIAVELARRGVTNV